MSPDAVFHRGARSSRIFALIKFKKPVTGRGLSPHCGPALGSCYGFCPVTRSSLGHFPIGAPTHLHWRDAV